MPAVDRQRGEPEQAEHERGVGDEAVGDRVRPSPTPTNAAA